MLSDLDIPHIIAQAERLRPGHTCTATNDLRLGKKNIIAHGSNIHSVVSFDDGHKWMVRIRQRCQRMPPYPASKIGLNSEAATFRLLHQHGLPVPNAWMPTGNNTEGTLGSSRGK